MPHTIRIWTEFWGDVIALTPDCKASAALARQSKLWTHTAEAYSAYSIALAIVRGCTTGPINLSWEAVLGPVTKVESREKNAVNAIRTALPVEPDTGIWT